MNRHRTAAIGRCAPALLASLVLAAPAAAQDCPCPPTRGPGWDGSVGAGLSLNSGNSDTNSFNVNASAVYDPQKKNLVRLAGLYLRSDSNGEATIDKAALGARDEYKVHERAFVFGEVGYQRDRLKGLDYLLAPAAGAGYKVVAKERATVTLDAGFGLVLEQLAGRDSTTDGALRAGQSLGFKLSDTATFGQAFGAIWKLSDFGDAFYHVEATLTTSVAKRLDLRLAYITDIKNRPANRFLEKRDSALVAAVVFKFRPS